MKWNANLISNWLIQEERFFLIYRSSLLIHLLLKWKRIFWDTIRMSSLQDDVDLLTDLNCLLKSLTLKSIHSNNSALHMRVRPLWINRQTQEHLSNINIKVSNYKQQPLIRSVSFYHVHAPLNTDIPPSYSTMSLSLPWSSVSVLGSRFQAPASPCTVWRVSWLSWWRRWGSVWWTTTQL